MLISHCSPTKPPRKFIDTLQGKITPWVDNGLFSIVDYKLRQGLSITFRRAKPIRIEFFATPLPPNPRNLSVPYLPFLL